ncbi:MAG: CSLREA domain-containing protein [Acidobacteriota bacterium]|nr:CSLREA domain-containing protein [Acidobacteriota bacterium]
MFYSGSDSWLSLVRLKGSRSIIWILFVCVLCVGLSSWINRKQTVTAAQSNRMLTLRHREEPDMRRIFEPQSFVEMLATSRWATPFFATIIVNTTADDAVFNSNCTLREAIMAANTNVAVDACQAGAMGLDMIVFNIGAGTPTINLTSALPTITEPVTINGNTNGATRVELNGAGAGAGTNGLDITAGSSTISSLVINRFTANGIHIQTNGGNTIQNSLIGVDAAGTTALANSGAGVRIDFAANNTIGGTAAGAGNVISGNGTINVFISGASASGNQVQGNLIGLDATGTTAIGGTTDGVGIDSAPSNTIGGTASGARNVISGHTRFGVNIFGTTATGNAVQDNFIGLNSAGTAAVANTSAGVAVSDTTGTIVGGTASGAGNVISGNGIGIDLFSGTGTQIQGNLIGTNPAGTAAIGNNFDGINIRASSANTIGGTSTAARNIISGNGQFGINDLGLGSGGNTIQGNYVGVDISGMAAIANSSGGVVLASPNNLLGGTASGAGNLISGNSDSGVFISGAAATGNRVQGNYIGLDAHGHHEDCQQWFRRLYYGCVE